MLFTYKWFDPSLIFTKIPQVFNNHSVFVLKNVFMVFTDAAQKHYPTTKKELEVIIGTWLSKASERLKTENR